MSLRSISKILVVLALLPVAGAVLVAADGASPLADPEVLQFVERAVPWYPDSTFEVVESTREHTPSGSYRLVGVKRDCASVPLAGTPRVLVDEVSSNIWYGSIGRLPFESAGVEPRALQTFIEQFLPEALKASMNMKATVQWGDGVHQPGAVIPFDLMIDTGYGAYRKQAAVSTDGKYLILGASIPLGKDPVAYRRSLLAESKFVVWDSGEEAKARVQIVEFSDLECPACRSKWPLVEKAIEANPGSVQHGMVSFPLTAIHPWAFRAASASWCVTRQDPQLMIPFKEVFYDLQREMQVSLVTPTAVDFVAGHGLDETAFRECYLRTPSIDGVHEQLSLGQVLGVQATPTYFVNGWMIQMPSSPWFEEFLKRLIAGEEP